MYAMAGYVLSPCPEVSNHRAENINGFHKRATENLLVKLFLPTGLSNKEKEAFRAKMIDEFWIEWQQFESHTGPVFGHEGRHIWTSRDITQNKSWRWHRNYTLDSTKWLGKLACKVCAKVLGIGSAERAWGAVKHLKDGQRSHLTPDTAMMQATIFGAACARRTKKKASAKADELDGPTITWEEADMDNIGMTKFGFESQCYIPKPKNVKEVNCWLEPWEKEIFRKQDLEAQARLLRKYGGLRFKATDPETNKSDWYTIDPDIMFFFKKYKESRWLAHA